MSTTTTDLTETTARVRAVLERRFGDAGRTVGATADLATALPNFDSLAALEFVTAVEDEFGVEVDFVGDDVRYSFSTVDRVVEYVVERLEDAG
ncbi:acyl carrier protein [Actinokineospora bangkokensis]|uniref:Carrier domain-containing protein n=1 Tax=Actinokineospora bangkokensis TaxID=1193682 RepID=A0A1Q9LKY7_9PSEU|nr:acyl carrier protein [Actinokineospora bangkokensis]OLR92680.1 hypothetical protein BJP25_21890 [Actinokineospora bangkokensis]